MRDKPIGGVVVALTVSVVDTNGKVITQVTETVTEGVPVIGETTPLYVGRMTTRCTEEAGDRVREMLQPRYGEIDPEWRKS